jgi:hypothetical protein
MEEKIRALHKSLCDMTVNYLYRQSRKNIEEIKSRISDIQEFVLWFLEGNRLGVDADLYQKMSINLTQILQDIVTAMEKGDHVLLNDAVAYGLLDYLELFMPEIMSEEGASDDNL